MLAALAGLLHDIGKVAQRADWIKGKHTDVGADFVARYVPESWRVNLYPAMGHHDMPLQGHMTKVVALANRLSAGERRPEEVTEPCQLLSIFCRLKMGEQHLDPEAYRYWPLKPLSLEYESVFPQARLESKAEVAQAYKTLWTAFIEEMENLVVAHRAPRGDLSVYLESLLLLLQRYTWCVPSAYYRSLPDVSLYDHSRTTAALAACLACLSEETLDEILRAPKQDTTPVALLVGGDISGVQDFIYTITARGATSALRGRSFYLQLLTEALARYVLRRLKLPVTNLLYQGGGHFYLLARVENSENLSAVEQEIERALLTHHRGDLFLAVGSIPLVAADFCDGHIAEKWDTLAHQQQQTKQRRFAGLDTQEMQKLFEPQGQGGNVKQQCQVCGREHARTESIDGIRKCPQCISYEKLGRVLRQARYLQLDEIEQKQSGEAETLGDWETVLAEFGLRASLTKEPPESLLQTSQRRVVLALKDDVQTALRPTPRTAIGRRFLVNVTPGYTESDARWLQRQSDNVKKSVCEDLPRDPINRIVKPFSLLEAQSVGVRRLGVVRMDVDDLGKLFAEGFGKQATLSRVAALSFAMSLYFEGWVEVLAERVGREARAEELRDLQRLYSIYSGGDDLFFVGAWDAVVEFTGLVRRDLSRYAAHHPALHASAGIVLVERKYPLYQAAEDAGNAETAAKLLRWGVNREKGKDAVTFLGQTLPWERFGMPHIAASNCETVYGITRNLLNLVAPPQEGERTFDAVPRSLLSQLMDLQFQINERQREQRRRGTELNQMGEEQVPWGPWMWRGTYQLKRMAKRYKDDTRGAAIEALLNMLKEDNFRAIRWIGLAARWAELLTRHE